MLNGKDTTVHLIVGLIKKTSCKKWFNTFLRSFGGNINVKVDLSNYAIKNYLKNVIHVDTSRFARKTNLASLKTEADKLDVKKLASVPVD